MPYTDEQKAEAVRLYLEVGPDEAAKQVGCSRRSIYGWLGLHGVQPKKPDELREETLNRHTLKRQQLRELLLDQSLDMLHRMNEKHLEYRMGLDGVEEIIHLTAEAGDCKNYALALGILIDKFRLENGETTGKTETVTLTLGVVEAEIQRLEAELGKRAPANT